MSKSNRTNRANRAMEKVITYILMVLLVLGIAGMLVYFLLRSQGVTYYVEYNGQWYLANSEGGELDLLNGKTHDFAVKSFLGEELDYDVTVQSNYSNNFTFTANGERKHFYSNEATNNDYSAVFGLQKNAEGFSISLPNGFTVLQAVSKQHGGDIELQDGYAIQPDLYYFVITVTSGESAVSLYFNFADNIEKITLTPSQVVF